jgi:hypothetical protein
MHIYIFHKYLNSNFHLSSFDSNHILVLVPSLHVIVQITQRTNYTLKLH